MIHPEKTDETPFKAVPAVNLKIHKDFLVRDQIPFYAWWVSQLTL